MKNTIAYLADVSWTFKKFYKISLKINVGSASH